MKTFHGTCNVASGKTADRKKTGQSRIKPDNMQLAFQYIQQSFRKKMLNETNGQAKPLNTW